MTYSLLLLMGGAAPPARERERVRAEGASPVPAPPAALPPALRRPRVVLALAFLTNVEGSTSSSSSSSLLLTVMLIMENISPR